MGTLGAAGAAEHGGDGGAAVFERNRGLLFSVAYDMLGSVADAEDCVQDTWIRWARDDRSGVADPKSYLVRIVVNVTLNRMRGTRSRRETYVGPWLPEPLVTAPDVADRVELADTVSFAMLVVLETLAPVERAVFVLREVFGLPHAEIAEAVGRTEAAVRQVAHRARERVHARRPRFPADAAEHRRLTEGFLAACADGDVDRLTAMLADDVEVVTDGGGRTRAALRPLSGAAKSARFLAAVSTHYTGFRAEMTGVNGVPGIAMFDADAMPMAVAVLEARDGLITRVLVVRNPGKLQHLGPDTGRSPAQ
ncbi:RNA polymerase sigma-70 factor [Nocardiopsis mangrovi]|uniref:RNA polymerase sigma-70 factor n=1 Tax=Nocardiopsis mangrovi TaxID=1179818 RepID=A0ABV9DQW6_9ACTN